MANYVVTGGKKSPQEKRPKGTNLTRSASARGTSHREQGPCLNLYAASREKTGAKPPQGCGSWSFCLGKSGRAAMITSPR